MNHEVNTPFSCSFFSRMGVGGESATVFKRGDTTSTTAYWPLIDVRESPSLSAAYFNILDFSVHL